MGYTINTMGWIILVYVIKGVLFMPKKTQWTCITPPKVSQKYIRFHNIFFNMRKGIA